MLSWPEMVGWRRWVVSVVAFLGRGREGGVQQSRPLQVFLHLLPCPCSCHFMYVLRSRYEVLYHPLHDLYIPSFLHVSQAGGDTYPRASQHRGIQLPSGEAFSYSGANHS